MTIAYLTHEEISRSSGVTNKINGQISQWKESGENVRLFSLKSINAQSAIENGEVLSVCTSKRFSDKYLTMIRSIPILKRRLMTFMPDIIYTRALLYAPGLIWVLRQSAPYVVEINSNDATELKAFSRIGHLYNLLTRNLFFKHAAGFVCVSNELATIDSFAKYRKPMIVIGNGIDTSKYLSIPSTALKDGPCQFVFIGTPGPKWHGIDKIGILAQALPEARFNVIGFTAEELENEMKIPLPENIKALGYMNDNESSTIIASSHIGIGTLSMYQKHLNEASALKVRQYLALGLPVILGCRDTDLSDHDLPFILDLPNTSDNISTSIEAIRSFSSQARMINREKIQNFAKEFLDTSIKEKIRLEFLHTISKQAKGMHQ